jgi:hypothetical protein
LTAVSECSWQLAHRVERTVATYDLKHCCLEIHRVIMNEAESVVKQILRLLDALLHTILLDSFIIVFDNLELIYDILWDYSLSELAHAFEAVVT